MSRKLSAHEVKFSLANMCHMPPDDVDGYVVLLAKGDEVTGIMTNAADEATTIALLARAIEQRSRAVGVLEDVMREMGSHG